MGISSVCLFISTSPPPLSLSGSEGKSLYPCPLCPRRLTATSPGVRSSSLSLVGLPCITLWHLRQSMTKFDRVSSECCPLKWWTTNPPNSPSLASQIAQWALVSFRNKLRQRLLVRTLVITLPLKLFRIQSEHLCLMPGRPHQ